MPKGDNLRGKRLPNAGRKKGEPNKTTKDVRALLTGELVKACSEPYIHDDGKEYINYMDYLKKKQSAVWGGLVNKAIPKVVESTVDLQSNITLSEADRAILDAVIKNDET